MYRKFIRRLQYIDDFSLSLVFATNELIYFILENYMLCYFVSNIIVGTGSIGDMVYNSQWYSMAHNEKFIVETIIRRSQRPYELKGLGVFVWSLETYSRVL